MYSKVKRKSLSIVIVLALVVSMFSGLGVTASASVPATAVPYTGQTAVGDYTIQTAAQLAELAVVVNGTPTTASYPYVGSNFWLLKDIDLSQSDTYGDLSWTENTAWTPIGGMCSETSYVPVGPYFSGTFNGSPDDGAHYYGVSNMEITSTITTANDMSGWGLFGAANGNIANLNVSGSIVLGRSGYTGEVHYAGGIVGYTAASVYNCQANMTITVDNGANLGTVVGGIESTSRTQLATPLVVEYCIGTGDVTGAFEVGGIVGGTYCQSGGDGNVRIGYSAYKGGTLTTTNSGQRAYLGGICGYNKGWIAYSYATNATLATSGGHYLAGAVGHQEGRGPYASIYNSYANVSAFVGADDTVDRPFIGTVDNSSVIPIFACAWTTYDDYDQPVGAGTTGWGRWLGGTAQYYSPGALNTAALAILNGEGVEFAIGTPTPVLVWESNRASIYVDPINPSTAANIPGGTFAFDDSDDATQIFVDGSASVNGDGTHDNPFNNIGSGLAALSATQPVIYIRNAVTLSSGTTNLTSTVAGATIKRSSLNGGYMFNLTGNVATNVTNITIDGNRSAFNTDTYNTATGSMFAVSGGAILTIGDGATLQNNYSGDGGAISVTGSAAMLVLSGSGRIISNKAANSGGAVVLHQGGTFNMSGGSIGGSGVPNVAVNNGGGVAVFNGSKFNLSGGTISYNTASNGGGVFAGTGGTTGGTFNMTGGTISYNIANNGGGVYVDIEVTTTVTFYGILSMNGGIISNNTASVNGGGIYDGGTFTVAPITGAAFYIADEIYVPNNVTITVSATLSGIIGDLNIRTATALSAGAALPIVTSGYTLTTADTQKIYYANTDDYSASLSGGSAVLVNSVFMDGSKPSDGTGARSNPYNNITSALNNVGNSRPVMILGGPTPITGSVLDLAGGSNAGAVFRRAKGYTGHLFTVAAENTAQVSGVYIKGEKLYVPTSVGSIFQVNGTLTLNSGAVLENNSTTGNGGGVNIVGGTFTMQGGSIVGNAASGSGGIYVGSGSAALNGGSVSYNFASGNGGGVGIFAQFTLAGTTISGNTATGNGGGLYINRAVPLQLTSGTISGNSAQNGGGIYTDYNITALSGLTITGNTASANGGGLYIPSGVTVTVTGGTFSDNTAVLGNGIYVTDSGTLTLAPTNGSLEFGEEDAIYLPSGVTFNIDSALDGGLVDDTVVPLVMADPVVNRLVAVASNSTVAGDSYYMLESGSIEFDTQDANIVIASLRTA